MNTELNKAITILAALEEYVSKVQEESNTKFQTQYPNSWANGQAPIFSINEGKRYFKVISRYPGNGGGSAFCFIDRATGDIFKPAGYNAPAKGARGNILNDKLPLTGGSMYRYR